MTYLAENGIPAIGDKEFDVLGYNGVMSAKSLYWLSRKREEDDEWTIEAERKLDGASVSTIAKNRVGTNGFHTSLSTSTTLDATPKMCLTVHTTR